MNDIWTFSALCALGGDVKPTVHFQRGKIRSHGRTCFQHLQDVSAPQAPKCIVYESNFVQKSELVWLFDSWKPYRNSFCSFSEVYFLDLFQFCELEVARIGSLSAVFFGSALCFCSVFSRLPPSHVHILHLTFINLILKIVLTMTRLWRHNSVVICWLKFSRCALAVSARGAAHGACSRRRKALR